jgi:hypothetical protein
MGLSGCGGRQQGLPWVGTLLAFQVCSPPGLTCSPRVTHPEFVGLERWAEIRSSGGHHQGEALGPCWNGAQPLAQNSRLAKSGCSEQTLSQVVRELWGNFYRAESWTLGTSAPFQSVLAGRTQAADVPSPLWGLFDNINISVYFTL